MANPLKGEVPLVLEDGRELLLVMDHEALIEAEGAYGKPLDAVLDHVQNGFVGAMRALLFGALRAKHPRVTQRDAAEILFEGGPLVREAISEAIIRSLPESKGDKDGANPPATQAGKTSGGNGARQASQRTPSGGKPRAPSHSSSGHA